MLGAWGDATPNGGLVQLRALDWDSSTIMQNYPLLLVQQVSLRKEANVARESLALNICFSFCFCFSRPTIPPTCLLLWVGPGSLAQSLVIDDDDDEVCFFF